MTSDKIEKILTKKIEIMVFQSDNENNFDIEVIFGNDYFWLAINFDKNILYDIDYMGDCENQNTVEKKCDDLRKYIYSLGFSQNTD